MDILLFHALKINILAISTSEIKITMVIDKSLVEKAVQVLHEEFELDK